MDDIQEVVESCVVGQEFENDTRIILFVRLREGIVLDDALRVKIRQKIAKNTTLHHIPSKILQVSEIPRTKSGKIVELAVRNVVHGKEVKNIEALANPDCLKEFRNRAELR